MPRKLPVLCPQLYDGVEMYATLCTRCCNWDEGKCTVPTGSEHLPTEAATPTCPLQERCQHQLQALPGLCDVRRAGLVCESALRAAGVQDVASHELSFNAQVCAGPDEI